MRVLLLADVNSIHTQRWAIALKNKGIEIAIFSLTKVIGEQLNYSNIQVFHARKSDKDISGSNIVYKLTYLSTLPALKKCIAQFKPDMVHAHYASSYGILGALSGFHPFILSLWGSDIFDFPKSSVVARLMLKYTLRRADEILSTSHIMADEAGQYTRKEIHITPFGIDPDVFKPFKVKSIFGANDTVIGTIKTLEPIYGVESLVRVFALLHAKHPELSLRLLIAGTGSLLQHLQKLTITLGVDKFVIFTGKIPHDEVPRYLNMLDVFTTMSVSESFGVSVIEASSCEIPVVVTNIGGLKEVVEDGVTGLLAPLNDPDKTVEIFEKLLCDEKLRKEYGRNGRDRVKKLYNWSDCVDKVIMIYQKYHQLN